MNDIFQMEETGQTKPHKSNNDIRMRMRMRQRNQHVYDWELTKNNWYIKRLQLNQNHY